MPLLVNDHSTGGGCSLRCNELGSCRAAWMSYYNIELLSLQFQVLFQIEPLSIGQLIFHLARHDSLQNFHLDAICGELTDDCICIAAARALQVLYL